jgi:hypothetical protein
MALAVQAQHSLKKLDKGGGSAVMVIDWGWLYGMEMDSYKSRFSDGHPDAYGTILYSFLCT